MSLEYIELDPNDYRVLHPRPAYLLVTADKSGKLNVMAASWVMPVNDEPLLVALAIDKGSKTYENLLETGELTINVVGEEHLSVVYGAGSISGKEVDKWARLGLEPLPSKSVRVPGVRGCYGFVECRVERVIDLEGVGLFICKSLAIHARKDLLRKDAWDLAKARVLMHNWGRSFVVPGKSLFASRP